MDMIECVARAIGNAARKRFGGTMMAWAVSPERQDCLVFARAAIEAMRHPTDEMMKRFNALAQCEGFIKEGWNALIDEALQCVVQLDPSQNTGTTTAPPPTAAPR